MSTKSQSFFMTIFSASFTDLTVLPQSRACSYYLIRRILDLHRSDYRDALAYAHMILRTLPTCDTA